MPKHVIERNFPGAATMSHVELKRSSLDHDAGAGVLRCALALGIVGCSLAGFASRAWAEATTASGTSQVIVSAKQPPLKLSSGQVVESAAQIDKLVLAGLTAAGQKPNPLTTDEQFVRRIYLDAAGRIPTAEETLAFVRNDATTKRAALVDQLLLSEGYRSQMFNWLADMLRVKDRIVPLGLKFYAYEEWLKDELAANHAWNDTVYEMLTAHGRLPTDGPAGYLIRDQYMPLDSLSNTLTVFLGANIACAQCHDHPLAGWSQRQFYELAAYFGGTTTGAEKPRRTLAEVRRIPESKALNEMYVKMIISLNFADVRDVPGRTLKFPDDYKYDNASPGDPVIPALISWDDHKTAASSAPTQSLPPDKRRANFAAWLTARENPRFAATISNRLWRKAFGQGVQEPVTDLDDLSAGANPSLLAHLAEEMKRLDFDLREFQRVLYNTQAYQRQASAAPSADAGPYLFPGPMLRRMTPEQAWDSILTLIAGSQLDEYKLSRSAVLREYALPPDQEVTPEAVLVKAKDLAQRHVPMVLSASSTPGVASGPPPARIGPIRIARASELLQPELERHFLRMFGQSSRDAADDSSLEGNIPQVLMLMNGEIASGIANKDALATKLARGTHNPQEQLESLCLSFLSRRPTSAEHASASKALQDGLSISDVTWALLNMREFIFIQ